MSDEEDAEIMRAAEADRDNPPLMVEQIAAFRAARDLAPQLVRRRGQRGPGRKPAKEMVTPKLDRDPVEHFRAGGEGWRTRINEVLRKGVWPER